MLDSYDIAILRALQGDATLTNADLSKRVSLSASQCSRRRLALERSGVIAAYHAELSGEALGFPIDVLTRVSLAAHSAEAADDFTAMLARLPEVRAAWVVTGDADYVLRIQARSLGDLAEFIHRKLQPHPAVAQLRTDVVLKRLIPDRGARLD